jgi:D-tyrosyl-tRNA(Tyr) deacylase
MLAIERNRKELGLNDFRTVTEATHWSGVYHNEGNPALLNEFPVAMMDIEVGSEPESWENKEAARALARSLTKIFADDGKTVHNLLCVGGVHFEPNFAEAVFTQWGQNEAFGVTHIIANQWLVAGEYENETGVERTSACIDAIEGGIEAIVFHDKMKGCYKDLVRALGKKYNIPIYKHQKLRSPETMEF